MCAESNLLKAELGTSIGKRIRAFLGLALRFTAAAVSPSWRTTTKAHEEKNKIGSKEITRVGATQRVGKAKLATFLHVDLKSGSLSTYRVVVALLSDAQVSVSSPLFRVLRYTTSAAHPSSNARTSLRATRPKSPALSQEKRSENYHPGLASVFARCYARSRVRARAHAYYELSGSTPQ